MQIDRVSAVQERILFPFITPNGLTFYRKLTSRDIRKQSQFPFITPNGLTFYRKLTSRDIRKQSQIADWFLLYHRTDWLFIVSLLHRISENRTNQLFLTTTTKRTFPYIVSAREEMHPFHSIIFIFNFRKTIPERRAKVVGEQPSVLQNAAFSDLRQQLWFLTGRYCGLSCWWKVHSFVGMDKERVTLFKRADHFGSEWFVNLP